MKDQHGKKFFCPACNIITKEAQVPVCEYHAEELLRLNDVITLFVRKYKNLQNTRNSTILLRFWAKYVENDPVAFEAVKKLSARWRNEFPDIPQDPDPPDPPGLF